MLFLLDFIPFWGVLTLIITGVLVYIFSLVSPTPLYNWALQIGGVFLMVGGVYLLGGVENQSRWEAKVKAVEAIVAQKEAESKEANVKIVEKIVIQKQIIKEKRNDIKKAVAKNKSSVDATCKLSNSFVVLHDSASQAEVPRSTIPDAEATSDVKASEALDIITQNYLTYYEIRDLVLQWQEWYKTQKQIQEQ